jgi:hypothetical protein
LLLLAWCHWLHKAHRRDDVLQKDAKDAGFGCLDVLEVLIAVVIVVPAQYLVDTILEMLLRKAAYALLELLLDRRAR